jgi:hypothetical protein
MDFNPSLVRCVLSNVEGLSPEWRFLLLCLLYEYSVESKEIEITVEQLVSQYGVTRTVCSEVSNFLSLPKNKLAQIRRSKVRYCEFDSVSLSKLSSDFDNGQYDNVHRFTVVDLLTKKSTVDGVKNECDLSVSNLLLLIILLIHSDSSGSVEGVSKAKIRKMMGGISSDRLKSQLKTLNKVKYILVDSRGGTGRKLFGKVSNNYLLSIGELQGYSKSIEDEETIQSLSVLLGVKSMARKVELLLPLMNKIKEGKNKKLFDLIGDDADRYMDMTRIIINKCERIVSIILERYWGELEVLTIKDCQFLDEPRMKSFFTAGSLFSIQHICSIKKPTNNDIKKQYAEEVLVTNDSFNEFLLNKKNADGLVIDAHYLTEFLLENSIIMAIRIKKLLTSHSKYEYDEIESISIGFGKVAISAYELVVSLRVTKGYSVYSISTFKKENKHSVHRVTLTTWKYT